MRTDQRRIRTIAGLPFAIFAILASATTAHTQPTLAGTWSATYEPPPGRSCTWDITEIADHTYIVGGPCDDFGAVDLFGSLDPGSLNFSFSGTAASCSVVEIVGVLSGDGNTLESGGWLCDASSGTFTATRDPEGVLEASLSVKNKSKPDKDTAKMKGLLTLTETSNDIDPVVEGIALDVGGNVFHVPAGVMVLKKSVLKDGALREKWLGLVTVGLPTGGEMKVLVKENKDGTFKWKASLKKANVIDPFPTGGLTFKLTIGDDVARVFLIPKVKQ